MELKNGWFLGKNSSGFFIWTNRDNIIQLSSKNFKEALKESDTIMNHKNSKKCQESEVSQKKKISEDIFSIEKLEGKAEKSPQEGGLFSSP